MAKQLPPLEKAIEALLMASQEPLPLGQLERLLQSHYAATASELRTALAALHKSYQKRAVQLVEVAEGWRFQVGERYAEITAQLWEEKPRKLSRAMFETLAIICYRQPVTRAHIEQIRSVSVSSSIIKTLEEFEWIKIVGRREVPGRPALYGTTKRFLSDFGLKKLDDLPALPEFKDAETLDAAIKKLQI